MQFYSDTNGPTWSAGCQQGGWPSLNRTYPATVCMLSGIVCSGLTITSIQLIGCQLSGTIGEGLGRITSLMSMYLRDNQIGGTLPPDWGLLRNLQYLRIYNNRFHGTLPPQWGGMASLLVLDLRPAITGTLPDEWKGMVKVRFLHLYLNSLRGTLPTSWNQMRSLDTLQLEGSVMEGTLPQEWSNLTSLRSVGAWGLRGTLPPSWGQLRGLVYLDLTYGTMDGTLPLQWASLSSLQELRLEANRLTGTVPPSWQNGMRSLTLSGSPCNASCSIKRTPNCNSEGWGTNNDNCVGLRLKFNCLNLTSLPPVNKVLNRWNWGNASALLLTPQRPYCEESETMTATVDTTRSGSDTSSFVTSSPLWSHSVSTTQDLRSFSHTVVVSPTSSHDPSPTASAPLIAVPPSFVPPVETTADSIVAGTIAGPLVGLTVGLSSVSNVQRGLLAMRLVAGCGGDGSGNNEAASSQNPLGLSIDRCGRLLAPHCGAVVGNLILLSAVTGAVSLYLTVRTTLHLVRHEPGPVDIRAQLAERKLPGLVIPVAVFLLQPTVASCLHLLWYTGEEGIAAAQYIVALSGLGVYGAAGALLRHFVRREMETVRATLQIPRKGKGFCPYAAKALGTVWVQYQPQLCLKAARRQKAHEFLAMFGALFQKNQHCRWWYYEVGLWTSVATGVLASVQPTSGAGCDAQRAVLVLISAVAAGAAVLLRPLVSVPLHTLSSSQEVISVVTAICSAAGWVGGVEVFARMQLGLSCCGVAMSVYRMFYARRKAAAPQKSSFLSSASREQLAHLVFTMSYPSQCVMQSEDRLRQLIVFITNEQQTKEEGSNRGGLPSSFAQIDPAVPIEW